MLGHNSGIPVLYHWRLSALIRAWVWSRGLAGDWGRLGLSPALIGAQGRSGLAGWLGWGAIGGWWGWSGPAGCRRLPVRAYTLSWSVHVVATSGLVVRSFDRLDFYICTIDTNWYREIKHVISLIDVEE